MWVFGSAVSLTEYYSMFPCVGFVCVCLCLYMHVCICVFLWACTLFISQHTIGVTVHREYLLHFLTFTVSQDFVDLLHFLCLWANAFSFIYLFCCDCKWILLCFYSCGGSNFASISQVGRYCRGWVPAPLWISLAYREICCFVWTQSCTFCRNM